MLQGKVRHDAFPIIAAATHDCPVSSARVDAAIMIPQVEQIAAGKLSLVWSTYAVRQLDALNSVLPSAYDDMNLMMMSFVIQKRPLSLVRPRCPDLRNLVKHGKTMKALPGEGKIKEAMLV